MSYYHEVIGIDLKAHALHVVRVRSRIGGLQIVGAAQVGIDAQANPHTVLQDVLMDRGWHRLPCILGLSGLATIFRTSQIPPAPANPEDHETIIDTAPMRVQGIPRFLEAETRLDTAAQRIQIPDQLGLNLIDLIPANLAVYNAHAFSAAVGQQPFLCADIGEEGTDLAIGTKDGVLFIRSFSSETLALDKTSPPREPPGSAWIEAWIEQVITFLDWHRDQATEFPVPRQIFLSGAGSQWNDFVHRVEEATGLPTARWEDPLFASSEEPGEYAAAFGLALTGMKKGPVHLSLMPPPEREAIALRWQAKYWIIGSIASILAALLVVWFSLLSVTRINQNLSSAQRQLIAQLQQENERTQLQLHNQKTSQKIHALQNTLANGIHVRAVIQAVAKVKHPDDWLTLIADEHSYFTETKTERKEEDAAPQTSSLKPETLRIDRVIIEGYTPVEDLSITREMIDALKAHPDVADADLLADDLVRKDPERDAIWAETGCRLFAVDVTLVQVEKD